MATSIDMTIPENRERWNLSVIIARLRIETKTGMKYSRQSTVKTLQALYPEEKIPRQKKPALKWAEDRFEKRFGRPYGDLSHFEERSQRET